MLRHFQRLSFLSFRVLSCRLVVTVHDRHLRLECQLAKTEICDVIAVMVQFWLMAIAQPRGIIHDTQPEFVSTGYRARLLEHVE